MRLIPLLAFLAVPLLAPAQDRKPLPPEQAKAALLKLLDRPKVPADVALNGWPGCTRFAWVGLSPAPGSALGSVAGGLAKFVLLNRLNTSTRSSALVPRPVGIRFASTRSI